LGHALVARRFGVETRDITLLPIGGVARLDRIPDKPTHELLVSFAGPAVNVALALTLWGLAWLIGLPLRPVGSGALSAPFLVQLFWLNVSLAIFNLLPAFPMDGGRVLRAALALKIDYVRATRLAAWLGQAMALAFAAFGLSHQPMLLLIAVFVWLGARREAARVELRRAASQARVANAMVTHFHVLSPNDRLGVAAELLVSGSVHGFPVLQGGELVGVLSREDVVRGIARLGASAPVRDAMNRKVAVARPADPLDTALARLESDATPIVVVQDHATVGMVTAEAIAEFMLRLRSELSATTDTESQMR